MAKLGRVVVVAWVDRVLATCPPAENPMMPTSAGLMCQAAALSRTRRMAASASVNGTVWLVRGIRYFSTKKATPRGLKNADH